MNNFKSKLEKNFHKTYNLPYETQHLKFIVTHTYTPDFAVSPTAAVELKGRFTGADRAKHKHIKKQHPEFTILIAFMEPNARLSKDSKTTYAAWCEANNILWCRADDNTAIQAFIDARK